MTWDPRRYEPFSEPPEYDAHLDLHYEHRKIRKRHKCAQCGKWREPGSYMHSHAWVDEDGFHHEYVCPGRRCAEPENREIPGAYNNGGQMYED